MLKNSDRKSEGSALDSLCRPNLYDVTDNISALQFEVMKIVPARYIIERAIEEGRITKSTTIVESSSGTFAVALGIVCAHYGLKLKLVTGPVSPIIQWRLKGLGADVDIIMPTGGEGGIQQDRMNHLKTILESSDDIFWPQQHSNPLNPQAYENLVSKYQEDLADIDYLICSTGTGGSITGISRKLREFNPNLKVVGVDHNLSCLFGPTSGVSSRLCAENYHPMLGSGSDVVHPNLDHTVCDFVHWVPVNEMILAAHNLHNRSGIYIGPTGAATYRVAEHIVQNDSGAKALCVFCDHGVRYADTVYNPEWLESYGSDVDVKENSAPIEVSSSKDVAGDWAYMDWGRRSYKDVLGYDCLPRTARL